MPTSQPHLLTLAVPDLKGSVGTHDPTIVREGSTYYRFATGDRIPVATSPDLVHWTDVGTVFDANPAWTAVAVPGSTWFWAPEVVHRDGRWRIYYSVSTFGSQVSAIGMASSRTLDQTSTAYRWRDDGLVVISSSADDFNAIDPAVVNADGADWLVWGSFWGGLKMVRLDPRGHVAAGDNPVLSLASRQIEPNTIEGGYILPWEGWYYLFASFDFCCRGLDSTYRIVVGRSRNVSGPYLDRDGKDMNQGGGTVIRDGDLDPRYAAMGHNSIFVDDGTAWLVFHGYDRRRDGAPVLVLERLSWDQGWPQAPGQLLKTYQRNLTKGI
jgi:arabinan endo-1,5-alpha-L-arabinosidase